jgi:hypothetical protein
MPGATAGDQLEAVDQEPPAGLVQVVAAGERGVKERRATAAGRVRETTVRRRRRHATA